MIAMGNRCEILINVPIVAFVAFCNDPNSYRLLKEESGFKIFPESFVDIQGDRSIVGIGMNSQIGSQGE